MSDIKKVRDFGKSRRTSKIKETLEQKRIREDNFLLRLDEIADEILNKRLSGQPLVVLSDAELVKMRFHKPEIFEVTDALFRVADKMK